MFLMSLRTPSSCHREEVYPERSRRVAILTHRLLRHGVYPARGGVPRNDMGTSPSLSFSLDFIPASPAGWRWQNNIAP